MNVAKKISRLIENSQRLRQDACDDHEIEIFTNVEWKASVAFQEFKAGNAVKFKSAFNDLIDYCESIGFIDWV